MYTRSVSRTHSTESALLATACVGVALGVLAAVLPSVLAQWHLTPDAIGYIATAYNWVEGAGFVDPVVYSYYLPSLHPPAPAMVIRPPLISALLALPLAAGAGLTDLMVIHTVWAAAIAAFAVLIARRTLSLPGAVAFGIAVGWAPVYLQMSGYILTEVTTCGALLLALATVKGIHRSHRRAVCFAIVAWIGWLTRPNLGVLVPAAACAVVLEIGFFAALRARPLWTCAATFVSLHQAVTLAFGMAYDHTPYAHYGLMLELLDAQFVPTFRTPYVGVVAFVQEHGSEIAALLRGNFSAYCKAMFIEHSYAHVGWFAAPAVAYAYARLGRGSLEQTFAACAGLILTAATLAIWGGFDVMRYPLPGVLCLWFVVCTMLDAAGQAIAGRLSMSPSGRARRFAVAFRSLPLAVVLVSWLPATGMQPISSAQEAWLDYRAHGTRPAPWTENARTLCGALDRDAVVASPNPWAFNLWCGTAGLLLPSDLETPESVDLYLDEYAPGFVVLNGKPEYRALRASSRLRRIEANSVLTVYTVNAPPARSRPWRAPPPITSRRSRLSPGPAAR
jgi:hypothetical protein